MLASTMGGSLSVLASWYKDANNARGVGEKKSKDPFFSSMGLDRAHNYHIKRASKRPLVSLCPQISTSTAATTSANATTSSVTSSAVEATSTLQDNATTTLQIPKNRKPKWQQSDVYEERDVDLDMDDKSS